MRDNMENQTFQLQAQMREKSGQIFDKIIEENFPKLRKDLSNADSRRAQNKKRPEKKIPMAYHT